MKPPLHSLLDLAPALTSDATAPPDCENGGFRIKRPCKTFDGAFFCGMEFDEWQLVRGLVRPANAVLELGGRFGTTSCVLAQQTGNSGRVVTVEPDPKARGWYKLYKHSKCRPYTRTFFPPANPLRSLPSSASLLTPPFASLLLAQWTLMGTAGSATTSSRR